jgi:hypothetical protein
MAVIRGVHDFDDHYTQIPNAFLRDESISLEARGLLAQILSHRPGWSLSIKSIAYQNRCGRDKVKRILDELIAAGYVERSDKQRHDENGHLAGYDYTTKTPEGVTQKPYKVKPYKAEPYKADGSPKKTISKKTKDLEDYLEDSFERFWSTYPKKADKRVAFRAFAKALSRVDLDTIVAGAERYRDDPNREQAFTKNPATWLNADAWENDPLPARTRRAESKSRADENAARLRELERGQ